MALVALLWAILGQATVSQADSAPEAAYRITDIDINGNRSFSDEIIRSQISTRANRNFLGVPGFSFWLWLHNLGDRGCCFTSGFAQSLKRSGEPPAILDSLLLDADVERIANFYRTEGYRSAEITAEVDRLRRQRVQVRYEVREGPPTLIDTLRFEGLERLSEEERRELVDESMLSLERPGDISTMSFQTTGERFSTALLDEERRRILSFLRDRGFAEVARDSIRAFVTPDEPLSFGVTLRIRPGVRYEFGDVRFVVDGPEDRQARIDTLVQGGDLEGRVVAEIRNDKRLRSRALERALRFQPGATFNQSELLATKRRLESTGLFTFTDFEPLRPTTPGSSVASVPRLPYVIQLRTRERHALRWEFFMLTRESILGDAQSGNDEIGVGLGTSYRNGNLFGSGEAFQLRSAGSIAASIRGDNPFSTAQAEVEMSLLLPYLIRPFSGLDRWLNLYDTRSRFAIRWLTARREQLRLIIRARASAQFGIELRHSPTLVSTIDMVDFSLSDPDTLSGFSDTFLAGVADVVEKQRILDDYSQPQVNNALRYSLRSATASLFRRDNGYIREASLEVGGNVPYLLDRYAFSPGDIRGSIPGVRIFSRPDDISNDLIYRQYVRFLVDLRSYNSIDERNTFAWKLIGGLAHPTGAARVVPFDRRFYSGGASSVRGWGLRQLGPGGVPPTVREALIQGGDIKLEASVELRTTILRDVLAANWSTAGFLDVGNVWYGVRHPGNEAGRFQLDRFYKEVGAGTGLGIRIAWDYLVIRFDLAYRLHEPRADSDTYGGFFPSTFGRPRLHFGIGHAF